MRKFMDIVRDSYVVRDGSAFPQYPDDGSAFPQYPDDAWRYVLSENITEYQTIPNVDFDTLSFEDAEYVGNINSGLGPLKVFKHQFGSEVIFGAGKNGADVVAELTVEYLGGGLAIMRTVAAKEAARGQGVASELALFVHAVLGLTILNDTQLSTSGEALRSSLIKSGHFDVKIYDAKTSAFHDPSEIGGPAEDGLTILHPKEDDADPDMWSEGNPEGQRFFWALKAKKTFNVVSEGVPYRYGVAKLRHRPGPSLPPRYFYEPED